MRNIMRFILCVRKDKTNIQEYKNMNCSCNYVLTSGTMDM